MLSFLSLLHYSNLKRKGGHIEGNQLSFRSPGSSTMATHGMYILDHINPGVRASSLEQLEPLQTNKIQPMEYPRSVASLRLLWTV